MKITHNQGEGRGGAIKLGRGEMHHTSMLREAASSKERKKPMDRG